MGRRGSSRVPKSQERGFTPEHTEVRAQRRKTKSEEKKVCGV
jgi:hypothetical protein